MTLSDFATFSTAISGLAVTASLIYLALQTHQSVKHAKALIHQGRAARLQDYWIAQLDAGVAAAVIEENGGEATAESVKKFRFNHIAFMQFLNFEDSFLQHQASLLSDDTYALTRKGILTIFAQPGFRASWDGYKVPDSAFAKFIDGIIAATPAAPV